jgi:membrane-associated phospholipid phosphatase
MGDRPAARCLGVLALAGCVVLLAVAVRTGTGPARWDVPVARWFEQRRTSSLTAVAIGWTTIGSTVAMAVYATAAVVVLWIRRHRRDAALVAVVGIGATALVRFGKILVGRARPPVDLHVVTETNLSFPSGHALASTAVLGVLAVVGPRHRSHRAAQLAVLAVFWAGIGVSRVYLGVHWPTDVLGGWLTGAAWLLLAVTVIDLLRSAGSRAAEPAERWVGPSGGGRRLPFPIGIGLAGVGFVGRRRRGGRCGRRCGRDGRRGRRGSAGGGPGRGAAGRTLR